MSNEVLAFISIAGNLLIAAFVYGRLTERVKNNSDNLDRVSGTVDGHSLTLVAHEGRISSVEGQMKARAAKA